MSCLQLPGPHVTPLSNLAVPHGKQRPHLLLPLVPAPNSASLSLSSQKQPSTGQALDFPGLLIAHPTCHLSHPAMVSLLTQPGLSSSHPTPNGTSNVDALGFTARYTRRPSGTCL